jgi:hypothetical protein
MACFFCLFMVIMELEKAKKILNLNRAKKLTEGQVIEIVAFAELLAAATINNFKSKSKDGKCHPLCESLNGRTSR